MVSGIKHHTTTTHPNSTDYDVSKSAWEENHDIDDAGIPQAKLAADIQVIGGPAWSNPTGSGPFVIQYNTGIALTRFCWFNGTVWDYIWGGNCRIKDFIVSSGTVTVNDCVFNTDVAGTALPQIYRATSAGNVAGIALATVVAPGQTRLGQAAAT